MTALDGRREWSPSYDQTAVTYEYGKELLPLTDQFVADFPETELQAPDTFNEVIAFLPDAYKAITRVPPNYQQAYADALYAIDDRAAELLEDGRLHAVLAEILSRDRVTMRELEVESHRPNPDIDLDHQADLLAARRGSLAARLQAISYFATYSEELDSIRLWNAFVETTALELEAHMAVQEEVLRRCGRADSI